MLDRSECLFWRKRNDKSGWEPRRLFNVLEFMMCTLPHPGRASPCPCPCLASLSLTRALCRATDDKDSSGSIDVDEAMEILYQRFGKEDLETRVQEFMSNDVDADKSISLTEFLDMMKRSDAVASSEEPSSKLSAGILAATKAEHNLLMRRLGKNTSPLGSPRGRGRPGKDAELQQGRPASSRPGTSSGRGPSLSGALKL